MKFFAEEHRKNLVVSVVGDESLHRFWITGKNRTWDLMLLYYGDKKNKYIRECEFYEEIKGKFKLETIHDAIQRNIDIIKRYEYIWLPDHDMKTGTLQINRLFDLARGYKLDLSQPALRSGINHKITACQPGCLLRYTNFVEMGCPLFKADLLSEVLPFFVLIRSGWGIDLLWSRYCEDHKKIMAIIDAVCIDHFRKRVSRSPYYQNLEKLGIDPNAEEAHLVKKYGLKLTRIEYGRIQYPLVTRVMKGICFWTRFWIWTIPHIPYYIIKRCRRLLNIR